MQPTSSQSNDPVVQPPVPVTPQQPPVVVQPTVAPTPTVAAVTPGPVVAPAEPTVAPPAVPVSPVVAPAIEPVAPVAPEPSTPVVQQPVAVAPATQTPQAPSLNAEAVYPTAPNEQQRTEQRDAVRSQAQALLQRSLSQFLILLTAGVFVVRTLFIEIKSLFGIGGQETMAMFDTTGNMIWQQRISSLLTIVLMVAALYAAYRVFRGGKIALALLTGALIMYIFANMSLYVGYALGTYQLGAFAPVGDFWFELVTSVLMLGGVVFAWVRERQFYS